MVLPELALLIGALGCLGRLLRPGVDAAQGKVSIDEPDLALVRGLDLILRFVTETLAEWSLEVAEVDDRDRRVLRAPEGVVVHAGFHHCRRRRRRLDDRRLARGGRVGRH